MNAKLIASDIRSVLENAERLAGRPVLLSAREILERMSWRDQLLAECTDPRSTERTAHAAVAVITRMLITELRQEVHFDVTAAQPVSSSGLEATGGRANGQMTAVYGLVSSRRPGSSAARPPPVIPLGPGGAEVSSVRREAAPVSAPPPPEPDGDGWRLVRKLFTVVQFAKKQPGAAAVKADSPANRTYNKGAVLVIDDDRDTRAAASELLADLGYWPMTMRNGLEALEYLRLGGKPVAILVDLYMPLMDGAAFCAACDADPRLQKIPRILVSAHPKDASSATYKRVATVLPKPLSGAVLEETLRPFAIQP